jgi:hypothetical protein
MFDDLTDAELATMRTQLRDAVIKLASGEKTAEVRYGETGRKFHPADLAATEALLNRVVAEIARRAGTGSGAIFPVTG